MKNLDTQLIQRPRIALAAILIAYLVSGTLFARLTPDWQTPDEPAHYNYIAHLAHTGTLPELSMGDFDMDYIGQIVGNRFPPELSVEPMRYEFYQPPLYYLSAVPIYRLGGGMADGQDGIRYGQALFPLRIYSMLLGLISLLLIYSCLSIAFAGRTLVALGATAFAATLPMHVAMTTAVNNDSLAILLLLAASLVLLQWMRDTVSSSSGLHSSSSPEKKSGQQTTEHHRGRLLLLGMLLGFGLLTKIYAYAFLPVCLAMVMLISWRRFDLRRAFIHGCYLLVPALLLGMSLWIRNMSLYGILDPLGLTWHDLVVTGQPTTVDWIAEHGWPSYWERAIGFTFRSFWGVFGWLGLFWDWRLYTAVQLLSIVAAAGLIGRLLTSILDGWREKSAQRNEAASNDSSSAMAGWVGLFLTVTFTMVVLSYVFYNLKFVQHQGRYFFWGMLPISAAFAIGWRQTLRPSGRWLALLALLTSLLYTLALGERNPWAILIHMAFLGLILLQSLLHWEPSSQDNAEGPGNSTRAKNMVPSAIGQIIERLHAVIGGQPTRLKLAQQIVWSLPFLFMFGLSLISLFGYILPQLSLGVTHVHLENLVSLP